MNTTPMAGAAGDRSATAFAVASALVFLGLYLPFDRGHSPISPAPMKTESPAELTSGDGALLAKGVTPIPDEITRAATTKVKIEVLIRVLAIGLISETKSSIERDAIVTP